MKTVTSMLATALVAVSSPALATTIGFDTLPGGGAVADLTPISNQYASLGVTFSGVGPAGAGSPTATTYDAGLANPYHSGNYLANYSQPTSSNFSLLAPRFNTLSVSFSAAASDVAFSLNTYGGQNSVTVNAYDAAGLLLQSVLMSANEGYAPRSLTATGISRIEFVAGINANGSIKIFGIDQLSFTQDATTAVPEPATWGMMIAGFGLVGGAMRRRRTAVRFA